MHPVLLSWGPIRLYSYGLLVAIGVLSAILFLRRHSNRIPASPDLMVDLAITTVVSGFIGARIFYVLQFWNYYQTAPLEILKIWEGGITLYGGIVGGFIGFSVFIWLKRLPFLALLDLFVAALALAQGFGRIGCFFNGCCYGRASNLPWSVSFPFLEYRVHPTQLYEASFCFLLAAFLFYLWRRGCRAGVVAMTYFILYPLGRFFFEFYRGDNAAVALNLTLHQWVSLVLIAASSFLWILFFRHGKKVSDRSA